MMINISVITLGFFAAVSLAVTDEERNKIKAEVLPILTACGSAYSVTQEDLNAAQKSMNIEAFDPCYYACFFKKIGILNEQGMFDATAAKSHHQKYISGADDIKQFDNIINACTSVNTQSVSDGTKGCERAMLVVRCVFDNKGSIDSDGKIVPKQLQISVGTFVSGGESESFSSVLSQCSSKANSAAMTDGSKGCERALQLLNCFMENEKTN